MCPTNTNKSSQSWKTPGKHSRQTCMSASSKRTRKENILTAQNWQKWKKVFLSCYCHEIYRKEADGVKDSNYTWKITMFVNMWNLGQFLEYRYFTNNRLIIVRIWKLFCTHVTQLDYLPHSKLYSFLPNRCSVKYRFPFQILRGFLAQNRLALLKDVFLKRMFLKRGNTRRLFIAKLKAEIILLL